MMKLKLFHSTDKKNCYALFSVFSKRKYFFIIVFRQDLWKH